MSPSVNEDYNFAFTNEGQKSKEKQNQQYGQVQGKLNSEGHGVAKGKKPAALNDYNVAEFDLTGNFNNLTNNINSREKRIKDLATSFYQHEQATTSSEEERDKHQGKT